MDLIGDRTKFMARSRGLTGAVFGLVGLVAAVIFTVAVFVLGDAVPGVA